MTIKPKAAFVEYEYDGSIEDFLDYCEDEYILEPTQDDYDDWMKKQMWATLCGGCFYEESIKLREISYDK